MTTLAALLAGRGFETQIHPLRRGVLGSTARHLRRGTGWALVAQLSLALERGATVHGHSLLTANPGFALLEAFTRLISWKGARWFETIHDGRLPERFKEWPAGDRHRYVRSLQRADRVIGVSHPLSEFLVDCGVPASRVITISPLLPSAARGEPATNPIASFFSSHRPVVLGVGAVAPHYDFRTLVAAYSALRATHREAGLVLLSSTFDRDDAYSTALAHDLQPLSEHTNVLEDVPSGVVRALMKDADVVVRGPARESYGLSRVEALLAGTPVVGTPVGEQRFVTLYDHGNSDSLVRALGVALGQSSSVAEEAREYFQAAADENVDRIIALYRGVTA